MYQSNVSQYSHRTSYTHDEVKQILVNSNCEIITHTTLLEIDTLQIPALTWLTLPNKEQIKLQTPLEINTAQILTIGKGFIKIEGVQ
jgi:hypothetical protein